MKKLIDKLAIHVYNPNNKIAYHKRNNIGLFNT